MTDYVVLVVEADETARAETIDALEATRSISIECVGAESVEDASDVLATRPIDCVISEYDLGEATGLELFGQVRAHQPDAGCVLYTERSPDALETGSFEDVIVEYVDRSADRSLERLATVVERLVLADSQTSYPLPPNESDRRVAIESLDLESDELRSALRRVTELAAKHYGVTHATVNVLRDHTQQFVACYGRAEDWDDVTREDSICTFTIVADDDVMTVPDVEEDPRFAGQEQLMRLDFRAYMGATIRTDDDLAIGTVCVYDEEPREFSEAEQEYLAILAGLARDLIAAHGEIESAVAGGSPKPGEGR